MTPARTGPTTTLARILIAVGAALALADASVVTLALPEILTRLDTTIEGVAAVIGVYTVVLAVAVLLAVPVRRRIGSAALGAGGMGLFALASVACGLADTLPLLLAARAVQAIGAAGGLVAAYALLHRTGRGSDGRSAPLWVAAAVFGTAIGPALGGALTELFDWRAIFLAQAPFGILAAVACLLPHGDPALDEQVDALLGHGHEHGTGAPTTVPPDSAAAATGRATGWRPARPTPPATPPRPAPAEAPTEVTASRAPAGEDAPTAVGPPAPSVTAPQRPPGGATAATATATAAAPAATRARPSGDQVRAGIALALVSAALTAVVFLLVLLLVSGWSVSPLKAAIAVTLLPVAALAGSRLPGGAWVRASAGSALVGAGILALASLPTVGVLWIVLPQLLAGLGMGLALPALAGELLPERTPRDAARLLALRHVGITVALLVLAPVTAAQLDTTITTTREKVTALVLDAKLPPQEKLEVIGPALGDLAPEDARGALQDALAKQAPRFADDPEQKAVYRQLSDRADDTLVSAVNRAFRPAFLITGLLALLAALAVLPRPGRGPALALAIAAVGLLLAGAQTLAARSAEPEQVTIADPCQKRDLPSSGGLDGAIQDVVLVGLDRAACRFGSSREELALAIEDKQLAKQYERKYGTDPRSIGGLLGGALGGGGGGNVGDALKNLLGN